MNVGIPKGPRTRRLVKLTEEDAQKIRVLHAEWGITYKDLSRRFGVGWEHIRNIVKGKKWKDTP